MESEQAETVCCGMNECYAFVEMQWPLEEVHSVKELVWSGIHITSAMCVLGLRSGSYHTALTVIPSIL